MTNEGDRSAPERGLHSGEGSPSPDVFVKGRESDPGPRTVAAIEAIVQVFVADNDPPYSLPSIAAFRLEQGLGYVDMEWMVSCANQLAAERQRQAEEKAAANTTSFRSRLLASAAMGGMGEPGNVPPPVTPELSFPEVPPKESQPQKKPPKRTGTPKKPRAKKPKPVVVPPVTPPPLPPAQSLPPVITTDSRLAGIGVRNKSEGAAVDSKMIRGDHAIGSLFAERPGKRLSERVLLERLVGSGLTERQASDYLEDARINGTLVEQDGFYKRAE